MDEKIRHKIERMSKAMKEDIEASDMTAHQVAWKLELSDFDVDGTRSLSLLYKILGGTRKFPHWLWGEWREVTGGTAAIREVCRQAGGAFYDLPSDEDENEESMIVCLNEFSDFMKQASDSHLKHSDGGSKVSRAEAETVEREGLEAIGAIQHLIERYNEQANRVTSPYAATLAEAVLTDEKGR